MEKTIQIRLSGNKSVTGILRTTAQAKNLIVFVHGITGHQNEHIFFNGSRFFSEHGCDSFRFNLYDFSKDARHFEDSTLDVQAGDLNSVLKYFRIFYPRIHVVGHSLGCPVILISNLFKINSIIFWEPSQQPQNIFRQVAPCSESNFYFMKARIDFLISWKTIAGALNFPKIPKLLKDIRTPIKIITAAKAGHEIGRDLYFANANEPKDFHNIVNSDHNFDERGAEEDLFFETLKWVQRN